jgi:hypothetical protein
MSDVIRPLLISCRFNQSVQSIDSRKSSPEIVGELASLDLTPRPPPDARLQRSNLVQANQASSSFAPNASSKSLSCLGAAIFQALRTRKRGTLSSIRGKSIATRPAGDQSIVQREDVTNPRDLTGRITLQALLLLQMAGVTSAGSVPIRAHVTSPCLTWKFAKLVKPTCTCCFQCKRQTNDTMLRKCGLVS